MQRPLISRIARTTRSGFTLIELVVVVAVLVILAGLVLPNLGIFKLKANKGVAASNMAGVTSFVESYRVQKDLYPDKFDSLLDSTGALYGNLDPQLTGQHVPGSPHKLIPTTIASLDELRSLSRMGITTVMDQDGTSAAVPPYSDGSAPNFSGNVARTLANGAAVATLDPTEPDSLDIIDTFYPQNSDSVTGVHGQIPANKRIFIFGAGPANSMNGTVLHGMPFYANTDQNTYYSRFLVAFEVDDGGSRARFLGTLGGDGDPIKDEIAEYYEL